MVLFDMENSCGKMCKNNFLFTSAVKDVEGRGKMLMFAETCEVRNSPVFFFVSRAGGGGEWLM